jgi:DNA integrity scanning protein DisA with diadenylate cyclase activity
VEIFNTNWKVLLPIFKYPTKGLTIRDIARLSNLSHTLVSKIVKELEKEEIVVVEKIKKLYLVKGNFENKEFVGLKQLYNLLALKKLVNYITNNYFVDVIFVFGFYSKGLDTENSDIDLFVGYKKVEIELKGFEKELERDSIIFR